VSKSNNLAQAADVLYVYDGSLAGFYSCVFHSIYSKTLPVDICPEEALQPSLYPAIYIATEQDKAERVRRSIPQKIAAEALPLVETVFLSCLEHKELHLLEFLLMGYAQGARVLKMLGDPLVSKIYAAQQHLLGEKQLLLGFIRFSDYGGALAAVITPKNFVLPFLAGHFISRLSGENFLIFDKTHKAALVYQDRTAEIIPIETLELPEASNEECEYRAMWKSFYKTISIQARYNPKCRRTHMPKRYWENMTEFN
jgi:probable DNA metabolism protein